MLTADEIEHLWKATRNGAYERAALAVEAERVMESLPNDGDRGYNTAVEHCAAAIRALKR